MPGSEADATSVLQDFRCVWVQEGGGAESKGEAQVKRRNMVGGWALLHTPLPAVGGNSDLQGVTVTIGSSFTCAFLLL